MSQISKTLLPLKGKKRKKGLGSDVVCRQRRILCRRTDEWLVVGVAAVERKPERVGRVAGNAGWASRLHRGGAGCRRICST